MKTPKIKCGIGIDFHRFRKPTSNQSFIFIGGVSIKSEYEVIAHSDGDVLLHALTDAILGVISAGDIGMHFPPSDAQWKNADSTIFVKHALKMLKEKGGAINNIDLNLICEVPRIGQYRSQICANIAKILEIDVADVNLKATTTEGLGSLGRKEGIAAQAMVCATF